MSLLYELYDAGLMGHDWRVFSRPQQGRRRRLSGHYLQGRGYVGIASPRNSLQHKTSRTQRAKYGYEDNVT